MNIIDGIIQELRHERVSTREVINRIPEDKWDWKPHEKSMAMGQLASHIVETFGWTESILGMDTFELDMETYKPYVASSKAELLNTFDQKVDAAIALMTGQSDEHVLGIWKMVAGGQVTIEMPRIGVIRMFTISHTIHHRAQLSMYLRLNDIPVPSIYGPSADE
jgi:uncharacterized damage-inducible protein DinB